MDGKLPPWNIHGSHSSSIPYAPGECQEVGFSKYISTNYDKVVNYEEGTEELSHISWSQVVPKVDVILKQ